MLLSNKIISQTYRDQDLITLKNGFQLLGHIVEQKPGQHVRIFRPTQNDTVTVKMEDIDKLSKIMIDVFAPKKITKKDTLINIGRFNNKKNVYQLSYYMNWSAAHLRQYGLMQGGSIAYYRSFNNKFFMGGSVAYVASTHFYDPQTIYKDSTFADTTSVQEFYDMRAGLFSVMLESKMRLSRKAQNRRITTLLGFNIGYVFDGSYYSHIYGNWEKGQRSGFINGTPVYSYSINKTYSYSEEYTGNYIIQTSLAFKVNPDNNSGFIAEPIFSFYSPVAKKYLDSQYYGYERTSSLMFSIRFSYFF